MKKLLLLAVFIVTLCGTVKAGWTDEQIEISTTTYIKGDTVTTDMKFNFSSLRFNDKPLAICTRKELMRVIELMLIQITRLDGCWESPTSIRNRGSKLRNTDEELK